MTTDLSFLAELWHASRDAALDIADASAAEFATANERDTTNHE